jgi:EpsI family protein
VAAAALLAGPLARSGEREGCDVTKLLAALAFLALDLYAYHFLATDAVSPERTAFEEFPRELEGGWFCTERQTMEDQVIRNLGVTDYLLCDFRNRDTGAIANVYVGYHATQVREEGGGSGENSIHPPAHCLPGSGWDIIQNQTVSVEMPGLPGSQATVKRLVIAKGEARQLVYYWYQSRGRVISQDWKKIVYVGLDRAWKRRTDGSLVRFTVPIAGRADAEADADATFASLAPLVVQRLPAHVPE